MSKLNSWMPLYIADYLADTATLSAAQHGSYMLLMMEIWRKGPIQNDMRKMARLSKMDADTFAVEIWPDIRDFFVEDEDGFLDQKRLRVEKDRAEEVSRKRAEAAAKRHAKKNEENTETPEPCKPDANAEQKHCKADAKHAAKDEQKGTQLTTHNSHISSLHSDISDTAYRASPDAQTDIEDFTGPAEILPPQPSAAPDARTTLFTAGLKGVRALTGKPDGASRALLGRWLKTAKDDAAVVNSAIRGALDVRPADPVAWIEGAVRSRGSGATRQQAVRDAWAGVPDIEGV